jgi:hypothetical protein
MLCMLLLLLLLLLQLAGWLLLLLLLACCCTCQPAALTNTGSQMHVTAAAGLLVQLLLSAPKLHCAHCSAGQHGSE